LTFPGRDVTSPCRAGNVLADPQPARLWRAHGPALGVYPARRRRGPWPGASGGRRGPGNALTFAKASSFDNQIARLDLRGREAELRIEKAVPEDWQTPRLHQSLSLNIAPQATSPCDSHTAAQQHPSDT
jgi:hypothetical protein